ncbi:MAG TPA: hypothetical protein VJ804_08150, partial [Acidimicrobiales bacterium]|nr:hypothetical protein [Acidimicrobiales bacterium]
GPEPEKQAARAAQRIAFATEPGPAQVLEPKPAEVTSPAPEPEPEPEPEQDAASAEAPPPAESKAADVFARLHAEAEATATSEAEPEPEPQPKPEPEPEAVSADAQAFEDRDRVTEPIERDLGRSLKRILADEQNEVLDRLRTAKPSGVDDLLPSVDAHAERWAAASEHALAEAAVAGASWAGGGKADATELATELARGVVLPLRERIERSFVASDGNLDDVADRVKALYREWKHQKLAEAVPHYVAAAYARGVFEVASGPVRWVADPDHGPCPDCDDNVLAGAIAKGEEFPTGGRCAPAHPGCRCLVLPTS